MIESEMDVAMSDIDDQQRDQTAARPAAKNREQWSKWSLPTMASSRPVPQQSPAQKAEDDAARQAAELEALRAQAREEGYQQGLQQASDEMAVAMTRWTQAVDRLAAPFQQIDEELELQLVQLTSAIARQVLRREIELNPEMIIGVLREALASLPVSAKDVSVRLHPDDAQLIRERGLHNDNSDWSLQETPTLQRGDCEIQSPATYIDERVNSRLNKVVAELIGDRRHPESAEAQ